MASKLPPSKSFPILHLFYHNMCYQHRKANYIKIVVTKRSVAIERQFLKYGKVLVQKY